MELRQPSKMKKVALSKTLTIDVNPKNYSSTGLSGVGSIN